MVSKPETGADVVRLARPDVGDEELAEIREVLESGQLTMGPKVAEFEALLADAAGTEHAVAVSSGTAALHVAVLALGIGPGDEVLVPAYTFPATANVVALAGATPVLVDVDPVTMNMDPAEAARRVSPRTKAVLAVHLFGRPARESACECERVNTLQLGPVMALATGPSEYTVAEVTQHLLTNAAIVQQFIEREIVCEGDEGQPGRVRIS